MGLQHVSAYEGTFAGAEEYNAIKCCEMSIGRRRSLHRRAFYSYLCNTFVTSLSNIFHADLNDLKLTRLVPILEKKMESMHNKLAELDKCLQGIRVESNAAGKFPPFFVCNLRLGLCPDYCKLLLAGFSALVLAQRACRRL